MKLYIAGSSKDIETAEKWIACARAAGFTITHDWPADIRKEGGSNPDTLTDAARRVYADKDVRAVASAEVIWFLGSEYSSQGMHVELGVAIHAERIMIFSGPRQSIFAWMVDEYYEEHLNAFAALNALRNNQPRTLAG